MIQARGDGMKLLRTKVWKPGDIALLKWCCIMFGLVFGSFLIDNSEGDRAGMGGRT